MSGQSLQERLLEDLEEIRGKYDEAELDQLRLHAALILLHVDPLLLREVADMRDRVREAVDHAPPAEDLIDPPYGHPLHEDHPVYPDAKALEDLSLWCWSIEGEASEDGEVDPTAEWE